MELAKEKTVQFLCRLFCLKEISSQCVLSQCKVYWINFHNIHIFTYQKTLLHTLFCLFLKSSKAFSISLIIVSHDVINLFNHVVIWFHRVFSEEIFSTLDLFFILYLKLLFQKCATYVLGCSFIKRSLTGC